MNFRDLTRKLKRLGCEYIRPVAGSHEIWWRPSHQCFTTIPKHANRDLPTGTLRAIIRDLQITKTEFDQA